MEPQFWTVHNSDTGENETLSDRQMEAPDGLAH